MARDGSSSAAIMTYPEHAVKAEVRADVAKTAVQVAPAEPKPAAQCAEPKSSQKEIASLPDRFMPSADHPMDECKPAAAVTEANGPPQAESKAAAPFTEADHPPNTESLGRGCRRKDVMEPPAKLSERIGCAKAEGSGDKISGSEQDPDFYKDWSGGSRYEVGHQPWNILGWFVRGIESRLHRK
jgi:hypothetical protein